jgi:hypothetical protein
MRARLMISCRSEGPVKIASMLYRNRARVKRWRLRRKGRVEARCRSLPCIPPRVQRRPQRKSRGSVPGRRLQRFPVSRNRRFHVAGEVGIDSRRGLGRQHGDALGDFTAGRRRRLQHRDEPGSCTSVGDIGAAANHHIGAERQRSHRWNRLAASCQSSRKPTASPPGVFRLRIDFGMARL